MDARAVLRKVAELPLSTWNHKSQPDRIRHIGPRALDFKAAFGLGESDTGITTVDADAVALAAIQGLNQKLEEQVRACDANIQALDNDLVEIKRMLTELGSPPNQALSKR